MVLYDADLCRYTHTVAIWNCSAKDLSGQMLARSLEEFRICVVVRQRTL